MHLDSPIRVSLSDALFWIYAAISVALVLFAGLMSGLTLGLLSLDMRDLNILKKTGTKRERRYAWMVAPLTKRHHWLLVTLLLCNAAAMEALPLCIDAILAQYLAIILSVSGSLLCCVCSCCVRAARVFVRLLKCRSANVHAVFKAVLLFGEIVPQAICSRYGLAIGAFSAPVVWILVVVTSPLSWPISKVLDLLLPRHQSALFRRVQLKEFISLHAAKANKRDGGGGGHDDGGDLTEDEVTIMRGALDLTGKTVENAMTPFESVYMLDVAAKLDRSTMLEMLRVQHSRIPVFEGSRENVIGLVLTKRLILLDPEEETPISALKLREVPRVPRTTPLYELLNQMQTGRSHIALVVDCPDPVSPMGGAVTVQVEGDDRAVGVVSESTPLLTSAPSSGDEVERNCEGRILGIITLEDVLEELLQEEIVDETDVYVDVARKIRVPGRMSRLSSRVSSAAESATENAVAPSPLLSVQDGPDDDG